MHGGMILAIRSRCGTGKTNAGESVLGVLASSTTSIGQLWRRLSAPTLQTSSSLGPIFFLIFAADGERWVLSSYDESEGQDMGISSGFRSFVRRKVVKPTFKPAQSRAIFPQRTIFIGCGYRQACSFSQWRRYPRVSCKTYCGHIGELAQQPVVRPPV